MPTFDISPADIIVLTLYVLGTRLVLGWWLARRQRGGGAEDYFLAGRNMRWPLIGLSFYVSNMSGSTFVALPASGYQDGIAVYNYEWVPVVLLVLFAAFILPFFLRAQVYTAPQFLEKRYDRRSRLAFAAFLLLANIFIDAAAALYAGATVASILFPDIPLWVTVAVTAAIAGGYIVLGGLSAVVINDAIQAAVILLGGCAIAWLAWQRIEDWDAVIAAAPPDALSLLRPASDADMPWPGIFTGILVIGFYFWCCNQFMIQRALGARSLDHARYGALFAGLLKLPNLFILILPGVMATALYPGLENPDLVFPTLVFDLLPTGLRGLLLAALAAAILSSLEAILNSASTLFTMDFVRNLRPHASERALVLTGRWATIGFMVLAALWAPQITRFPTLWQYLQSILAYVTPPVVAVFVLGLFWPRASAGGALLTLSVGVPLGVVAWLGIEVGGLWPLQFLYACGILLVINLALHATASLMTPAPGPRALAGLIWRRASWRRESRLLTQRPWYADYRWLSVLLLTATAILVAWWA